MNSRDNRSFVVGTVKTRKPHRRISERLPFVGLRRTLVEVVCANAAIALVMFVAPALFAQSQIVEATVHSPGLEHNLLGDPPDQNVAVYLPDAYRKEPERRFSTIYFLHGFDDTPVDGVIRILQEIMDQLVANRTIEPMIVVAPNGLNRYYGSFYTNSEVTGNWEDYIVKDVVGYVDVHFRTLPTSESRGISGHSMGGYGALMLAFRHPDVFSNVYGMSPCCTVLDADFGPSNPLWARVGEIKLEDLPRIVQKNFLLAAFVAMDAAFAPDPNNKPLLGDPPFHLQGEQLVPDPVVLSRFDMNLLVNGMHPLLPRISKLRGIYIDYGAEDEFSHIPPGARALSAQLALYGVPHIIEVYEGSHGSQVRDRIETRTLPWFSKQLKH